MSDKKEIKDHFKTLAELLAETGAKMTFDPYRDITKGCGDHCKGMNRKKNELCTNHMSAVIRGDYAVPGGRVDEIRLTIIMQRDFEKQKTAIFKRLLSGEVSKEEAQLQLEKIEQEVSKALPAWAR